MVERFVDFIKLRETVVTLSLSVFCFVVVMSAILSYAFGIPFDLDRDEQSTQSSDTTNTSVIAESRFDPDDYSFSLEGCEEMWRNEDWNHYWRCVEGSVELGENLGTIQLGDSKYAMPADLTRTPWNGHKVEFRDEAIEFGSGYRLVPSSNSKKWALMSFGGEMKGIYARSAEDFTPEEMALMVSDLYDVVTPGRLSDSSGEYRMIGAQFEPIINCGRTPKECDKFYKDNVGVPPNEFPRMGTSNIRDFDSIKQNSQRY